MKLEDLENYRDENGFIDMDLAIKENDFETIDEVRGAQNRDKFWIVLDDSKVLIRNENLDECEYRIYAELLMEELAKQVGIDSAHYDIIIYNGKRGVISKDVLDENDYAGMYTIESMIENKFLINEPIDILTIWNSIKEFALAEKRCISKDKIKKAYSDIAKIAIFDTFTMSNDRHSENMALIFGSDKENNGEIFRVSPLFDNECSLMLDKPIDEIDELLNDVYRFKNMVSLQEQNIIVPEELKENVEGWKDMLYFLTDEYDEIMDFTEECYNKLDIKSAICNVENRIGTKLPSKLKEFVSKSFDLRKESINKALILSIDDMEVLL